MRTSKLLTNAERFFMVAVITFLTFFLVADMVIEIRQQSKAHMKRKESRVNRWRLRDVDFGGSVASKYSQPFETRLGEERSRTSNQHIR